jgi:hypothetical protein
MRKCKCLYCGLEFDRDKLPYTQVTERRYAHKECAEKFQVQKSQDELDYDALADYIENLFGVGFLNAKIVKQIKDYRTAYNYTYSGMLGTLVYWYEVKKAPIDKVKANGGIGIIPYIYDDAKEYYNKINQANQLNANFTNYMAKVINITIEPPQKQEVPVKLFKLEEDNI